MNNSSDVFHIDLPDAPNQEENRSDSEESINNTKVPEVGVYFYFRFDFIGILINGSAFRRRVS